MMFGRDDPKNPTPKVPGPEDFKGDAVARAVLKETLEHPATIYPAAGSALALGWTVLIAASPTSVALTLGCAFLSTSAFIYNYIVKGPERATAHISKLRELRKAGKFIELDAFKEECESIGMVKGVREADELRAAYDNLNQYLQKHQQDGSAARFQSLAEDTFQQGASALQQALAIYKAMISMNINTVQRETDLWRTQRESAQEGSARANALDLKINAHIKQLELYRKRQEDLTQLFAQVDEIESALQSTYLQLVDLGSQNTIRFLADDGDAASRLQTAVDVARRVEEKLRGSDIEDDEKRNKYRQVFEQQQLNNGSNDQQNHYEEK